MKSINERAVLLVIREFIINLGTLTNDDWSILECQDVPANGKRLSNDSTVHHSQNECVRGLKLGSSIIESYFVILSANKPGDQPGLKQKPGRTLHQERKAAFLTCCCCCCLYH